jgi:multiple sugar transport system ATP-binding protein
MNFRDGLLGVRPEHLDLGRDADAVIPASVRLAEHLGAETMLYLDGPEGSALAVRADGLSRAKVGDRVEVALHARSCHLFDEAGNIVVSGSLL